MWEDTGYGRTLGVGEHWVWENTGCLGVGEHWVWGDTGCGGTLSVGEM